MANTLLIDALFAAPTPEFAASSDLLVDGRLPELFSTRPQARSLLLAGPAKPEAAQVNLSVGVLLRVRDDGAVVVALRVAGSPSASNSDVGSSRSLAASPPELEASQNRLPASHASAELADALFASTSTEARVDGLFASRPQAGSRPLAAEVGAEVPYEAATMPAAAAATHPRTQQPDMRSDDPAYDLHQLLFMVHGIGQHEDFVDGQFLSWDGTEGMAGGNHEFRGMLEALLGGKLHEVPLWLSVQSVEWHAQLHRPEIDAMVAACSPEGVSLACAASPRSLGPTRAQTPDPSPNPSPDPRP